MRGYKYTLVLASVTKWALRGEMPIEMRLDFLNHLDKMPDGGLTAEIIASVEPMGEEGLELTDEARKLGPFKALDVYADKFEVFAALNPSLQRAYDAARGPRMVA